MDADQWTQDTNRAGELAGQLAQVQADLVTLTIDLLRTHRWAGDGVRSPAHWLQVYSGLSPAQARNLVRIAERAEDLSTTTRMMAEGRLTLDQAAVIAEHVPTWALDEVEPIAELTTVTQLRRAVANYPFDRQQPPHEEPRTPAAQQPPTIAMSTINGRFQLRFATNAIDGALIEQAIREAKDALFTAGNEQVTLAEALVEVASRSLTAVDSASRRDRYKVMLHLSTDGSGWLERRGALPQQLLAAFTCDGTVRPVWETDGVPVSVGRAQRIVPDRTRRLVEDRDKGCRYPGCPATGFLENHHITHWEDGGPTDIGNLVSLCSHHHRSHHQGEYTIAGEPNHPGGLTFSTTWGVSISRAIEATPPDRPDRPPPMREGLRGERINLAAINFGQTPRPEPEDRAPRHAFSDWSDLDEELHSMVHLWDTTPRRRIPA